ncbi:hypothetical protein HK102_007238 [Quaeritorhiza haematococci]|nr:hypothetical protein HK102_007238 [Quaeritorhiza haematococci]
MTELKVLSRLGWTIRTSTPNCYAGYFISRMPFEPDVKKSIWDMAQHLLSIAQAEYPFLRFKPAVQAIAALKYACNYYEITDAFDNALAEEVGQLSAHLGIHLSIEDIRNCTVLLFNCIHSSLHEWAMGSDEMHEEVYEEEHPYLEHEENDSYERAVEDTYRQEADKENAYPHQLHDLHINNMPLPPPQTSALHDFQEEEDVSGSFASSPATSPEDAVKRLRGIPTTMSEVDDMSPPNKGTRIGGKAFDDVADSSPTIYIGGAKGGVLKMTSPVSSGKSPSATKLDLEALVTASKPTARKTLMDSPPQLESSNLP